MVRVLSWAQILGPTADPASASAFVALQGGEPLGFIAGGAQRDTALAVQGFSGEISAIYVLQRAQNCGLGRRLMAAMARSLGDRGHGAASLWVLRDNAPARRFYERLGGMVIGEKEEPCGAVTLAETAYGWPDLAPLTDIGATPGLA